MKHFKTGHVKGWTKYVGEELTFDAKSAQSVMIKVIASGAYSVFAEDEDNKALVATGRDEAVQCTLTINKPTKLHIAGGKDVYIWLPEAQGTPERKYPGENFVSLEPRSSLSPEMYRMELRMRENQMKFMDALNAEKAARLAAEQAAAQVIEPEAPAEPTPEVDTTA